MKCELCQTNEAEVAIQRAADGQVREMFVCAGCAQQAGGKPTNPLVELLFGSVFAAAESGDETAPCCSACGLSRVEFRKRSRLGCPLCYEHLAREIAPLLRDMHRGSQHVGKVPRRERLALRRAGLEERLKQAVAEQRFEDAAQLRDRIRELQVVGLAGDTAAEGETHAAR